MEIVLGSLMGLVVALVIFVVIKKLTEESTETPVSAWTPYYLKPKTLNVSEHALFYELNRQLGSAYIVLIKVRIEDFIGIKSGNLTSGQRFGYRNRIKSRHVDFLICDRGSKPLMVVELDGKSHLNEKRQERDDMLDAVYGAVGIKYKHIKVGAKFSDLVSDIKQELVGKHHDEIETRQSDGDKNV